MNYPHEWLKYVDADTVACGNATFDGLRVESPTGENLGRVDAFIVDSASGRPYYVVVDAGGWFKSKHFLLPIGHARLDTDADSLVADVTRDRVSKFPGFDKDEFDKLTVAVSATHSMDFGPQANQRNHFASNESCRNAAPNQSLRTW